jgi:hypothetical protein
LRSASSSANITDPVFRLPYSRVTSPWFASTLDATDSIGVIPEPAAMHR